MYQKNAVDAPEKLPVVDWGDALERSANKPKLAYRLLEMLIDGADSERQSLERAWADRDRVSLADISHRMVGAARYAGVPRLRAVSEIFLSRHAEMISRQSLQAILLPCVQHIGL